MCVSQKMMEIQKTSDNTTFNQPRWLHWNNTRIDEFSDSVECGLPVRKVGSQANVLDNLYLSLPRLALGNKAKGPGGQSNRQSTQPNQAKQSNQSSRRHFAKSRSDDTIMQAAWDLTGFLNVAMQPHTHTHSPALCQPKGHAQCLSRGQRSHVTCQTGSVHDVPR